MLQFFFVKGFGIYLFSISCFLISSAWFLQLNIPSAFCNPKYNAYAYFPGIDSSRVLLQLLDPWFDCLRNNYPIKAVVIFKFKKKKKIRKAKSLHVKFLIDALISLKITYRMQLKVLS